MDLPSKIWKIALCSLSIGIILQSFFFASFFIKEPAETTHSLLAIAIIEELLIDSIKGLKPAKPTIEAITISDS